MNSKRAALRLEGVGKRYREGGGQGHLTVLREVSLRLAPGELTALVGPSGSGKSTLLHIAGLLDSPDRGEVWIAGKRCGRLDEAGRTLLRRVAIGFVYQFHHLLPEFSALENVAIPRRLAGASKAESEATALDLLGRMGLAARAHHRPAELSGGEQQRVAIARAVANRPLVLLADEPTGNLDPETSEKVFQELTSLARRQGLAALIATHNMELAARMDRVLRMSGGRLVED
ncbi:ABC transporter ATP-binding protein [Neomegalonema perideroedes]|uniref:ABC transporter ATP-binding protein n=1 Tax=Neomegalonema perideroedes TaxID=217219 RepID=UPI000373DDFB|nr:ABC transporter ATP-binding protein [Neomegalonema perideroedes]